MTNHPGITYLYDNNGNLTSKSDSTTTTSYIWDFENRMTRVLLPGGFVAMSLGRPEPIAYFIAHVLKVIGGAAGGFVALKRAVHSSTGVCGVGPGEDGEAQVTYCPGGAGAESA